MLAEIIAIFISIIIVIYVFVKALFTPTIIKGGRMIDRVMEKHKRKKFVVDGSINIIENMKTLFSKYDMNELRSLNNPIRYFDQIPYQEQYKSTEEFPIIKSTYHFGQLKLFLSELSFLTQELLDRNDPKIVIYAGSAPSNKMGYLSKLFPNVKFILVDPNEHLIMFPINHRYSNQYYDKNLITKILYFKYAAGNRFEKKYRKINYYDGKDIKIIDRDVKNDQEIPENICEMILNTDKRFYIIEDYMTMELASILSKLGDDILFISDIRSVRDDKEIPNSHIFWNNAMQYNWVKILNPTRYMLKYRPPYLNLAEHIKFDDFMIKDMVAMYGEDFRIKIARDLAINKYKYLVPDRIELQSFAPLSSSETRLIGSALDLMDYDLDEYENKMYYMNTVHRNISQYNNEYFDFDFGICNCFDCSLMCSIFIEYFKKYDTVSKTNIATSIINLITSIGRALKHNNTAHCFSINSEKQLNNIIYKLCIDDAAIKTNMEKNYNTDLHGENKISYKDLGYDIIHKIQNSCNTLKIFPKLGFQDILYTIYKEFPNYSEIYDKVINCPEKTSYIEEEDKYLNICIKSSDLVMAINKILETKKLKFIIEILYSDNNEIKVDGVPIDKYSIIEQTFNPSILFERLDLRTNNLIIIYLPGLSELGRKIFYKYFLYNSNRFPVLMISDNNDITGVGIKLSGQLYNMVYNESTDIDFYIDSF